MPGKPEKELVIADDLDEALGPEGVPDTLPAPERAHPCPHPQPHGSVEGRHSGRPCSTHRSCKKDCKKVVHGQGMGVKVRDHSCAEEFAKHPDTGNLVPMDIPVHKDLHEIPKGRAVREVRVTVGGHVHVAHHWSVGGTFCYDVTDEGLILHPCPDLEYSLEVDLEDGHG